MKKSEFDALTHSLILDRTASRFPDNTAIIFKDRQLTWCRLRTLSIKLAKAFLKAGVKKGDRIGIMMTNVPEWAIIRAAILRSGAWLVPINTRYKISELKQILTMGKVNVLMIMESALGIDYVELMNAVCPELGNFPPGNGRIDLKDFPYLKNVICLGKHDHPGMHNYDHFIESGQDVSDQTLDTITATIDSQDVSTLLYTAGTTGQPKGVMTKHYQFIRVFSKVCNIFDLTEQDVILGAPPFFTNFGLCMGLTISELSGAAIVAFESFESGEILESIEKHRITTFAGTPAMFYMILNHENFNKEKVRSLRVGDYGGAPMTPENIREIMDKLGMTLFAMYGMTETTGLVTVTEKGAPPELVATTVGKNFNDGCEVKIIDLNTRKDLPAGVIGEIVTRGWHVTQGYYNDPGLFEKTRNAEGWLYTGDLGVMDEEGNLKFIGRIKELVISGGMNIDPLEIENFIIKHPAVESVHIVGLPDRRMGEVVGAFIKRRPGVHCTIDEILAFCEGQIAKYKIPKYIKFIDEVPRTPVGKVQKFKMREIGIKEFHLENQ